MSCILPIDGGVARDILSGCRGDVDLSLMCRRDSSPVVGYLGALPVGRAGKLPGLCSCWVFFVCVSVLIVNCTVILVRCQDVAVYSVVSGCVCL